MMYQAVPTATTTTTSRGGIPTESGDYVVTLDQIPRWSDVVEQQRSFSGGANPLAAAAASSSSEAAGSSSGNVNGMVSKFPVDHEINSKIYLWRGEPWNLEVDAVVNSTNENLDEAHSSPGLHAAAGPGLAEQCATLGGCRTGMAKVTNAYDLPARRVIHTVGPKYAVKYHTAAENALSHCYRSCLEILIDNGLQSIATDWPGENNNLNSSSLLSLCTMANLTLELNIYSAKDLENVNLITKMDVYAVVWINGDDSQKNRKEKTAVDRTGGSEHTWNHAVKLSVDQRLAREDRLTLVVKLVCDRMFGGKDLGEVQVPVLEMLSTSPSFNGDGNGNGNGQGMRFVTYQVRTPSGKGQGSLTFSYRFDVPSFTPDLPVPPVQPSPIDTTPDLPPPPASYPPASEAGFYPPLSSIGYPPSSQPQVYPAPPCPYPYQQPVTAYPPSSSASNLYPPPPSYGSSPQHHSNVYPSPSYGGSPPHHFNVYPPPPDKPGHSYHQMQPSHSFHGYAPPPPDKPGHAYHQMQPSHSFHGYGPPSPQTQHVYCYPPPPGYGHGHPPTQTPPRNNKPGLGLGMGAGLLGGALGGLLLGDLVSDL